VSVAVNASSQPSAAAERSGYLTRLGARIGEVGSALCLGIDPDPRALPAGFPPDVTGIERFASLLLEAAATYAAAVKCNLAFFEAFGSAGIAALERLRARVPPTLPFIADAKRGDIASTVARQAVALFDALGADAITVNPYLGGDALEPFLARNDRFAYVLCRTSNSGAAEFQDLAVDGAPLYLAVAHRVADWSAAGAPVGLVVGATAPNELGQVRAAAPGLRDEDYYGFTRRQYKRLRELEVFLFRAARPELDHSGLGLRLRWLTGGMSPAARPRRSRRPT